MIGLTDDQKKAVKAIRSDIWDFYASLKNFKEQPDDEKKANIEAQFGILHMTPKKHVLCP